MMLWIDSVRSTRYQIVNVAARATANTAVLSSSGIPRASVRLSVISVPTTLTSTTVSQYTPGTYWRGGECPTTAAEKAAPLTHALPPTPPPHPPPKTGEGSPPGV